MRFYIKYINRVLVICSQRPLIVGRAIVYRHYVYGFKNFVNVANHSFPGPSNLILISSEEWTTPRIPAAANRANAKGGQESHQHWEGLESSILPG